MARVLLLSLVFPPDGVSTAQLMGELAEDLTKHGHDVYVVTTKPHYNHDHHAEAVQPLTPVWLRLLYASRFRGIPVLHTIAPGKRGGMGKRVLGWATFHALAFGAALRLPRPDVILVPSPLLTAGVLAWALSCLRRSVYVYNVQELYPDLAVELGMLRNRLLIRALSSLERFVYQRAAAVTCISQDICRKVRQRGTSPDRVHMIPNFVDLDDLKPGPNDNAFARELGLTGSFVVSYAGNMGHAQGLDSIIDAAAALGDERIRLLMVGDGVLRQGLEQQAAGAHNVIFVPHQPYARMGDVYAASDVSVVPLLGAAGGSALPSKVFRIMACGRAVVAICETNSELADLVRRSGAGIVVPPRRADVLAQAIAELATAPEEVVRMGDRGREYVAGEFCRSAVTGKYATLFATLASGTKHTSSRLLAREREE
jgi:colanic acid biosynthesis glycosyl transferase WcaI